MGSCVMEIRKISVDRLLPAKYNPRKDLQPGDPEFEKLKRSVEEFGYVEPIIWNQRTGIVVGGHQRLKVLQHLGYTEVDCVVLDIDEQKEKALNVALNKISGDWDMPLLTALLKDLDESGFDATLTGFDVTEMSDMFDDQSEIVEDEPPAVAPQEEAPITQPGDRWLLGDHVLYCGDSTKAEDVAALMAGAVADLCITDPPYNVAYEGSNGKTIQNDNMPEEQFVAFLTAAFKQMHAVMKAGAPFYIWHAETEGGAFRRSCSAALGKVRQMLIWNKNSFTMGHQDYQWKHEACIYGWTDGAAHYFVD
ncbi:MAG: DNA modification methylase, partial [Christensenellaceae bacterium]|nr:DNA modification methylase [Christensenellaceae bacterium]